MSDGEFVPADFDPPTSMVTADRAHLDGPLADAVAGWLESDWPWERIDRNGR
jgi:hypothetical protein